jgi:hypothetical protein
MPEATSGREDRMSCIVAGVTAWLAAAAIGAVVIGRAVARRDQEGRPAGTGKDPA